MKKVLIIGCPGSGKSTFARKLQNAIGLPLYYLDMLFWNADKTTVTDEEFDNKLDEILEKEEWIIDGNYCRTMEMRLERCDTVFFFDLPAEVCIEGIKNRVGTVRPDMPWIENEVDGDFLQFVKDFKTNRTGQICEMLDKFPQVKKIVFKNRRESEEFLQKLTEVKK